MRCLLTLLLLSFAFAGNAFAQTDSAELNQKIESYILENPETILKSLEKYQIKQAKEQLSQAQKILLTEKKAIFSSKTSPVLGNKNGDVTVVEFSDYQCPYCKQTALVLQKILQQDKNVKVILKELPVLGKNSIIAAAAALAANDQGKYEEYHFALMQNRLPLSEGYLLQLAQNLGLNLDKFKEDLISEKNKKEIQANLELAQRLGVRGTPGFIIGEQIFRGALDKKQLETAIETVRKGH